MTCLALGNTGFGSEWRCRGLAKLGDRVLGVCCGSGDLSFPLSHKVGCDGKVFDFSFSYFNSFTMNCKAYLDS
ncbi:hypothetical protein ACSQ67_003036 [Phaseolus vulgaris]